MSSSETSEFWLDYARAQIPANYSFASELTQLLKPDKTIRTGRLSISYSQSVIFAVTCLFDRDLKTALAAVIEPVQVLFFAVMRSDVRLQRPITPRVHLSFLNKRMEFAEDPGPSWSMDIELGVDAPFVRSRIARPHVPERHPEILKCSHTEGTAFSVDSRPLYFEVISSHTSSGQVPHSANGGNGPSWRSSVDSVPEERKVRVWRTMQLCKLTDVQFSTIRAALNDQCGGVISSTACVKHQVGELIVWADGITGIGFNALWNIAILMEPGLNGSE